MLLTKSKLLTSIHQLSSKNLSSILLGLLQIAQLAKISMHYKLANVQNLRPTLTLKRISEMRWLDYTHGQGTEIDKAAGICLFRSSLLSQELVWYSSLLVSVYGG